MDSMRACACGLRRTAACSMPGRLMSSTYWPRPRTNRGSSLRSIRPKPASAGMLGGPPDRTDDVLIARTPADLPGDRLADLGFRRVRVAVEQPPRGHHHARRAETALEAVALDEPLLDGVELAVAGQVLDGPHGPAVGHGRQHG